MQAGMLADALARQALAVCRYYLPSGTKQGRYWICGDVYGTPGRSLFVRISGRRAGKWCDAATGEYGDLLDLIMLNRGLGFRGTLAEARSFLHLPRPPEPPVPSPHENSDVYDPVAAARRLCGICPDHRHICRTVSAWQGHIFNAGSHCPAVPPALLLPQ